MPVEVVLGTGAIAAALALGTLAALLRRPAGLRERLTVASGPAAAERTAAAEGAATEAPLAQRALRRFDGDGRLAAALERAGSTRAAANVLTGTVVGSALGALLGLAVARPVGALVLVAAPPLALRVWLSTRADRRRRAFADQLEDALQLLASGLRAGHSLVRAVDAVSRDTRAPMSEEFSRVVNEVRVGRDLTAALDEVADRTGSEDFRWVVQAIGVHREVGGNLAEVLDRVGDTLRDRAQLFRQARALSAEGRTSGLVLLVMPFAVVAVIALTSPAYLTPLVSTGTGVVLVLIALALMLVGALWLRSIVKVRF